MTNAVLDIQDAISLLEQRESRKAADVLEQIVAEMPAYATARVLLARCYEALDDWDLALAVWQEALQLVPNSPVIRQGVERTVARSGGRPREEHVDEESDAGVPAAERGHQDVPPAAELRAEDVPPAAERGHQDVPPAAEHRARDLPSPAEERRVRDMPPAKELRAQDVPPPTHQPPRPRDESRPADAARPRPDAADPTSRGEGPEPPAHRESAAPHPTDVVEPSPPADVTDPSLPDDAAEPSSPADMTEPSSPDDVAEPPRDFDAGAKPDFGSGAEPPDDLAELRDVRDTGTPHYEDLDRLISELESARIVPRPDLESVPSPDLEDDIEDVVSETLARIYASQGQYDEAARVYELLAGQHPEDADDYLQKASYMRSRASDGP